NSNCYYASISNSNRHKNLDYIATVYNGINAEEFSFNEQPEDYLIFFGRIHPHKGTAEAIQIAQQSQKRLKIVGIIQDEAYFKKEVEPFLNDDITFIGAAGPTQRNELLGKAAALLHPISFDEPFGLSVAEAMLCGTPVIAFNRGAMPELIKDKRTGFLVNNMKDAITSVTELKSINRADCHQWALENFTTQKMVDDYLSIYHQILNK
ncbi:glycosyltransferase, partial [Pedobacter sp.]|uniref:glycosyltransferase n=1 Tax=Pedobacter sp. TaxID=1411316 RepID=UPI003D7FE300